MPAVGDPGTNTVSPPNDWASKILASVAATLDPATGSIVNGATGLGLLTLGTGDAINYANTTNAQRLALKRGTAASPDTSNNPVFKIERTIQLTSATYAGDGSECCAGIVSHVKGTATNDGQTVGVYGHASSASTTAASVGGDDACGLYGQGRITGSGTGSAIGAFLIGRRDTNTGNALGVEVAVDNNTATPGTYTPAAFNATTGIWLHAHGASRSAIGLAIGNPFAVQLDVGIGILSQGTGGPVLTTSFQDNSQSINSLVIDGTHTVGLGIDAGAGYAVIGALARLSSSALLEVVGPGGTVDPLVQFGTATSGQAYTILLKNGSGVSKWWVAGGAGNFVTGSADGDAGFTMTSTKKFMIGTSSGNPIATFKSNVALQAGTGETVGFTAGGGTTVTDASTFTGNVGTKAYRISDIVKALKNYNLLQAS
jgi:hypothetical protein